MKSLHDFLTEAIVTEGLVSWKVRYEFTKEDIEFFKKNDKFHWDAVVNWFGDEPNVVACNQRNLIIYCKTAEHETYIWFQTKDVPAQRVKAKNDSDLDISYIKDFTAAAGAGEWTDECIEGSKEICIQALKWMIERGITK